MCIWCVLRLLFVKSTNVKLLFWINDYFSRIIEKVLILILNGIEVRKYFVLYCKIDYFLIDECFDDDISIYNNFLGLLLDSFFGDSFSEFIVFW